MSARLQSSFACLWSPDRTPCADLQRRLALGKPAVSRALDALRGLGLATRIPDETDRRSVLVQTTARGLAVLAGLGDRVIACEKAHAGQEAGRAEADRVRAQPPASSRPVAQPSAPRDGAGPSSHAA